tara:strand:+ start:83 stop:349 length:267 start_codon:yes stop_codon:yes gene_type:complete
MAPLTKIDLLLALCTKSILSFIPIKLTVCSPAISPPLVTENPMSPFFLDDSFFVRSKTFDSFNFVFLPLAAYSPRDKAVPDGASFLCL